MTKDFNYNHLVRPFGPPIGLYDIPEELCTQINSLVDSESTELIPNGENLAGQIEGEFRISSAACKRMGLGDYLLKTVSRYIEQSIEKNNFVHIDRRLGQQAICT